MKVNKGDVLVNKIRAEERIREIEKNRERLKKLSLDKDAFIKLLITELRYQDPTKPLQDKEFIAQLAQFSALQEMNNISVSIDRMTAIQLFGRNVRLKLKDGEIVGGRVVSVYMEKGRIFLKMNDGSNVNMDDIKDIRLFSDSVKK
jgi:flagellar basal-body rod modification protein FlgD